MYALTQAQALNAIALHANNNTITVAQVQQLLGDASVTFASLLQVTQVQLAAQHKQQCIQKVTRANVLLAANVSAQAAVYARAVRKSAAKHAQNDVAAVQQFAAQQNYFVHTALHCIVAHAQHADKLYLFAIYNSAASAYVHNNVVVSKQHVAQYCTASAAKALLQASDTVHNKTHNIMHNVHARTVALSNIVQLRARKQLLSV